MRNVEPINIVPDVQKGYGLPSSSQETNASSNRDGSNNNEEKPSVWYSKKSLVQRNLDKEANHVPRYYQNEIEKIEW